MNKYKSFIEITPIYPLPVPLCPQVDYLTWPVKMMQDHGYNCSIYTIKHKGQKSTETINGILVLRFNNYFSMIIKLLSEYQDIFYINGKSPSIIIALFKKNVVFIPHGSYGQQYPLYINNRVLRSITRLLWNSCRKIICITPYEARVYSKFKFKKNYTIIPNAIDYDFYQEFRPKSEIIKKYRNNSNTKIILFVGNIHGNVKNIETLYRAFIYAAKKANKIKLIIAGKVIDHDNKTNTLIETMMRDKRIILTGLVNREIIASLLKSASCFVNTSFNEGHSLAVAEAASSGIPLCLSKIGTFTSVYKKRALYHDPEDHHALVNNILYVIKQKDSVDRMVNENKKIIQATCNIPIVKRKLLAVFERI